MEEVYMTVEGCRSKHRVTKWALGVAYAFAVLLLVVVGWSLGSSSTAAKLSTDVQREFQIHEARQAEQMKGVDASLKRIEADLSRQTELLEEIRLNGHKRPSN